MPVDISYVNVKWAGATGDGSTDDQATMQYAENLFTVSVPVFFPPGEYRIAVDAGRKGGNYVIWNKDHIEIYGTKDSWIITDNSNDPETTNEDDEYFTGFSFAAENVTVHDLNFRGCVNTFGADLDNLTYTRVYQKNMHNGALSMGTVNFHHVVVRDCIFHTKFCGT